MATFTTESSKLCPMLGVTIQLVSLKRPERADNIMSLKLLEGKKKKEKKNRK